MQATVALEKNEVGLEDKLETREKLHTEVEPEKDKPVSKLKGRLANTGLKIETKGDVKEEVSAVLDCCLPKMNEGKSETIKPSQIKVSVEKDGKIESEIKPESKLTQRTGLLKTGIKSLGLEIQAKGQVSATVSKLACCDSQAVPSATQSKNPPQIKVEINENTSTENARKLSERPRMSLRDALSADKAGIDIKTKGEISNKVKSQADCCDKDKEVQKVQTVVPKVEVINNAVEKPKVSERDTSERRERVNPIDEKPRDFVRPRQEYTKDFHEREKGRSTEDSTKPIPKPVANKALEVPPAVLNTFNQPKQLIETQERNNPRAPSPEALKTERGIGEKDFSKLNAQYENQRKTQETYALFKQKIITEAEVIRNSLKKRDSDSEIAPSNRRSIQAVETTSLVQRSSSQLRNEKVLSPSSDRNRHPQPDIKNASRKLVQKSANQDRVNSSAFKSDIRIQKNISSHQKAKSLRKKSNTDIISHRKISHLKNAKSPQSKPISFRAKISNKIKFFAKKLYISKIIDARILNEKRIVKKSLIKLSRQISLITQRIKRLAANKVFLNIRRLYVQSNLQRSLRQNSLRVRYKKFMLGAGRLIRNFRQNKINSKKIKNKTSLLKKIRLLHSNRLSKARSKVQRFREKLQRNGILLISRDKKVRQQLTTLKKIIHKLSGLNLKKDNILFRRKIMLAIRRRDMRFLRKYLGRFSLRYQMILKELSTEELRLFLMMVSSGKKKKRKKHDTGYVLDEDLSESEYKKPL